MKFTRETPTAVTIRSVSADGIRVGNDVHAGAIALTTESILGQWDAGPIDALSAENFAELLTSEPEIILLGTGVRLQFAPRDLTFALAKQRVGLEVMDTAAAARTFNVLAGEGRRVAAVLYP